MRHIVKSYAEIYALNAHHEDHVDVVDDDGNVLESYRFEQVWGTSSLAVLFRKGEHDRRFETWLQGVYHEQTDGR